MPESGTIYGRRNILTIPINKDPDVEYKNEFIFGYTLKETVCGVIALVIVIAITALAYFKWKIPFNIGCYFGIPLALPVIILGFREWYGMSVWRLIKEMRYEKKTKELAYDADEIEEYITPVTLRKKV